MTTPQVRMSFLGACAGDSVLEKDVTRRFGWLFVKKGDILNACEKCQGLGKGGKIVRICQIRVKSVRREYLNRMITEPRYGRKEVRREGFPNMTAAQFVAFFCQGHAGVTPGSVITRIEFEYVV